MKILKYLLFTIGGIIALVLVVALFVPKTYHIERAVVIHAPRPLIMEQIKNLKKANEWSPFMEQDPNMQISYGGTDGEVGAFSHWNSKKAGIGTQTITKLTNDRIAMRLDFEKPMKSTAEAYFQTENTGEAVKITWAMEGQDPYPFNFMCLFMDNMLGKEFEKGLNNLKTKCEEMAKGNLPVSAAN